MKRTYSRQKRRFAPSLCIALCTATMLLTSCSPKVRETGLLGSWQLENHSADARLTYFADHTWVMTLVSSNPQVPTGTEWGDWKLDGNQLTTITRSTLDNHAVHSTEACEVTHLDGSTLSWTAENSSGQRHKVRIHRTDSPGPLVSDSELAQKLQGTWSNFATNASKALGTATRSLYRPDGSASWSGTFFSAAGSKPLPKATGVWLVSKGFLVTTITNAESPALLKSGSDHDLVLLVTDSDFTYRDERGVFHKALKQ